MWYSHKSTKCATASSLNVHWFGGTVHIADCTLNRFAQSASLPLSPSYKPEKSNVFLTRRRCCDCDGVECSRSDHDNTIIPTCTHCQAEIFRASTNQSIYRVNESNVSIHTVTAIACSLRSLLFLFPAASLSRSRLNGTVQIHFLLNMPWRHIFATFPSLRHFGLHCGSLAGDWSQCKGHLVVAGGGGHQSG